MINIPQNIKNIITSAATLTGVDENLLIAIAYVESGGFNPSVINGEQTSKTSVKGLFQITETTWAEIHKKDGATYSLGIFDQALSAAQYIQTLNARYANNLDLVLIAYNAGPEVANRLKGKVIDYISVSNAVQHFIDKGMRGFGPNKISEVWNYPQKVKRAMGEQVSINPSLSQTFIPNTSTKQVTSYSLASRQQFDPRYSVMENFTIGEAGIALSKLTATITKTPDLRQTKLISKLRRSKSRKLERQSLVNFQWG